MLAGLLSDWAVTIGRLFGAIICLPCKDGGVPLSALSKDNKRANYSSLQSIACLLAKQRLMLNQVFESTCITSISQPSTWMQYLK